MRAGKLDTIIDIIRPTTTVDDFGTVVEGWTTVATMKAQVIQSSTEEYLKGFGNSSETATIFRVRWRDDLDLADLIVVDGRSFNLKEIKELGRRAGLELRAIARDRTPNP